MSGLTLYQLLALPSTATRDQIRLAYLQQIRLIRSGELPAILEDSTEEAYAILAHPDRRIEYDLMLAIGASGERERWWAATARKATAVAERTLVHLRAIERRLTGEFAELERHLKEGPADLRLPLAPPTMLTWAAVIAGICALALVHPWPGIHRPPVSSIVARRSTAPISVAPPAPAAPVPQAAAPTEETSPAPDQDADADANANADTDTDAGSEAAAPPAPAAPARAVAAPPRQQPVAAYHAPVARYSAPAAYAEAPAPDEDYASAPDSAPGPDYPAAPPAANVQAGAAMAVASPFGGKTTTFVVGRYCRDDSGGEIFTPVGAPAAGLVC